MNGWLGAWWVDDELGNWMVEQSESGSVLIRDWMAKQEVSVRITRWMVGYIRMSRTLDGLDG